MTSINAANGEARLLAWKIGPALVLLGADPREAQMTPSPNWIPALCGTDAINVDVICIRRTIAVISGTHQRANIERLSKYLRFLCLSIRTQSLRLDAYFQAQQLIVSLQVSIPAQVNTNVNTTVYEILV